MSVLYFCISVFFRLYLLFWDLILVLIIDFIRCSCVFDNIKDLVTGITKLKAKIGWNTGSTAYSKSDKHCIKRIVRIKNGFVGINDNAQLSDSIEFDYADIKLNVLIEWNGTRMIGEIQLLPSFMLKAKKNGDESFVYNGQTYKGKKHDKLGMVYKKA